MLRLVLRTQPRSEKSCSAPSPIRDLQSAFTLVELLVVIAIIAILAALLMPVLHSAQLKAQRVQCMDNMRQLGYAWIMYPDDCGGKLVPNVSTSSGAWQTGPSWDGLANYMAADANPTTTVTNGPGLVADHQGLFGNYVGKTCAVFKCPGDTVPGPFGQRVRSYSMNSMMNGWSSESEYLNGNTTDGNGNITSGSGPRGSVTSYRLYQAVSQMLFPGPVDLWVMIDEHGDSINDGFFWVNLLDSNTQWEDVPASYHGESTSLAFGDGHAETRVWSDPWVRDHPVYGGAGQEIQKPHASSGPDLPWLQSHTTALP